jgi:hypothetical protein
MKKYGKARQATDENIIRRTRNAFWLIKATGLHSEYVILFFHGNNNYANAPECNVYTYIACPVIFVNFCFFYKHKRAGRKLKEASLLRRWLQETVELIARDISSYEKFLRVCDKGKLVFQRSEGLLVQQKYSFLTGLSHSDKSRIGKLI